MVLVIPAVPAATSPLPMLAASSTSCHCGNPDHPHNIFNQIRSSTPNFLSTTAAPNTMLSSLFPLASEMPYSTDHPETAETQSVKPRPTLTRYILRFKLAFKAAGLKFVLVRNLTSSSSAIEHPQARRFPVSFGDVVRRSYKVYHLSVLKPVVIDFHGPVQIEQRAPLLLEWPKSATPNNAVAFDFVSGIPRSAVAAPTPFIGGWNMTQLPQVQSPLVPANITRAPLMLEWPQQNVMASTSALQPVQSFQQLVNRAVPPTSYVNIGAFLELAFLSTVMLRILRPSTNRNIVIVTRPLTILVPQAIKDSPASRPALNQGSTAPDDNEAAIDATPNRDIDTDTDEDKHHRLLEPHDIPAVVSPLARDAANDGSNNTVPFPPFSPGPSDLYDEDGFLVEWGPTQHEEAVRTGSASPEQVDATESYSPEEQFYDTQSAPANPEGFEEAKSYSSSFKLPTRTLSGFSRSKQAEEPESSSSGLQHLDIKSSRDRPDQVVVTKSTFDILEQREYPNDSHSPGLAELAQEYDIPAECIIDDAPVASDVQDQKYEKYIQQAVSDDDDSFPERNYPVISPSSSPIGHDDALFEGIKYIGYANRKYLRAPWPCRRKRLQDFLDKFDCEESANIVLSDLTAFLDAIRPAYLTPLPPMTPPPGLNRQGDPFVQNAYPPEFYDALLKVHKRDMALKSVPGIPAREDRILRPENLGSSLRVGVVQMPSPEPPSPPPPVPAHNFGMYPLPPRGSNVDEQQIQRPLPEPPMQQARRPRPQVPTQQQPRISLRNYGRTGLNTQNNITRRALLQSAAAPRAPPAAVAPPPGFSAQAAGSYPPSFYSSQGQQGYVQTPVLTHHQQLIHMADPSAASPELADEPSCHGSSVQGDQGQEDRIVAPPPGFSEEDRGRHPPEYHERHQ